MTNKLVTCDYCHEPFTMALKEKRHRNNIIERYFKCSHCYYHYTVSVTNKRVRKLQRTMKHKRERARRLGDHIGVLQNTYIDREYIAKDPKTNADVLITKSKEQLEIDKTMNILKYNLVQFGIAGT